ncbi:MAG: hypothetical protein F6K35_25220, partial [Okeania sp. SIO2H7]|nr:hypothetical protein [Okeania sp. SIO2H7]
MYDSPELTPSYTKNYANDSWQQPLLLAFLASVGIHAILGINLPNIPLFSKPVKLPPTVGLVELTTEQIARLPKPKTEGEISFENIQLPSNISQIPQQQPSFPRLPPTATTPSVSNLPRTSVGRSSYEYEIPERPLTRSPVPLRLGRNFPSSVGSLPPNETPRDDFYTYIPPRPTPVSPSPLPIYRRPLPETYPPSLPPLPNLPEENQGPTEAEIRANIQFDNNEVDESGLFTGNSTRSFLEGVPRPQERYQDKIASRGTNSQQTRPRVETPATTVQPPAEPDPTKINRLPESPLARQIREGKTLREVLNEEANQPERVAVVIPENPTPEVEQRENPPIAPKVEERPAIAVEEQGDFKDLFLADLERSRQQRGQTTLTPEPVATPKPEPITPTPTVAALPTVEPTPVPEAATEVEASPVPETAIEVEPTPE